MLKRKVVFVQVRHLQVGWMAEVLPLNHPSDLVTNGYWATTSPVQKINTDGSFETQNTLYVPLAHDKDDAAQEMESLMQLVPA